MTYDAQAAQILAVLRDELAGFTFDAPADVIAFLGTPYVEERVALAVAAIAAEQAEAEPQWSPV